MPQLCTTRGTRAKLGCATLLTLAACESRIGEGSYDLSSDASAANAGDAGWSAAEAGVSAGDPGGVQLTPCAQAAKKAQSTLQSYCASCHGPASPAKGGFATILDANALLASGKVVAGQPMMSLLFKRMSAGAMPPAEVQKRPTPADVQVISDWIGCGAPDWNAAQGPSYGFVDIDARLHAVLSDLRSLPNPVDRQRMRYFDLTSLANAGFSQEQLQVYREAVSFLVNSLSRGRSVIAPVAIDDAKLIFRIDLRDYLWDAQSWNQLERGYPYGISYDQDSRLFPYDEVSAEQVRNETRTTIPVIQGDWFVSHASRPPLYHQLLNLPDNLADLERQLGVDVRQDIASEQVLRAGFKNAGPSQNHRVIERHELGGNRGAMWLSYDFQNNLDQRNIFAHPLDFQQDGGELIFNLDNGLQGYFIINNQGARLDKAPNVVVQDPLSRDGAVENGISCMNCHQQDGQLPKSDEIRQFVLTSGTSAAETERVLALYVEADVLNAAFEADQNRYRTARGALGIQTLTDRTFHLLDDTHQGVLDINGVAGVIGIPTDALERALDATPGAFPQEIVALRQNGGGVQRDAFEAVLADLLEGLGLGTQLRVTPSRNDGASTTRDAGTSVDAGVLDAGGGRRRRGDAGVQEGTP